MGTTSSEPEIVTMGDQTVAVIAGRVPMDELPQFFDASFTELFPTVTGQGVDVVGPAFARYHGMPGEVVDLEVGFPTSRPVEPSGSVAPTVLPAGRVATLSHHGSFDSLGESWGRLGSWIAEQGERPSDVMWEVYVTEPSPDMDPADLRTELYWPLATD